MTPNPPPHDAITTSELTCLNCGYSLRGLRGDPVRCPECAYENRIATRHRQLRELERFVETSVGRHVKRSIAACLSIILALAFGRYFNSSGYFLALAAAVIWTFSVLKVLRVNRLSPHAIVNLALAHVLIFSTVLAALAAALLILSLAAVIISVVADVTSTGVLGAATGMLAISWLLWGLGIIARKFAPRMRRAFQHRVDALCPLRPPPWRELGVTSPDRPPQRPRSERPESS